MSPLLLCPADLETYLRDLPVAAASGYAMTVDATGKDRITWSVGMSADLQGQQTETLLIHNGKARLVYHRLFSEKTCRTDAHS